MPRIWIKGNCESLKNEKGMREMKDKVLRNEERRQKQMTRLGAVRYKPIHEKEGKIDLLDKPLKLEK